MASSVNPSLRNAPSRGPADLELGGISLVLPERLEDWIGDDDPVLSFLNPAFCEGGNIISR